MYFGGRFDLVSMVGCGRFLHRKGGLTTFRTVLDAALRGSYREARASIRTQWELLAAVDSGTRFTVMPPPDARLCSQRHSAVQPLKAEFSIVTPQRAPRIWAVGGRLW